MPALEPALITHLGVFRNHAENKLMLPLFITQVYCPLSPLHSHYI